MKLLGEREKARSNSYLSELTPYLLFSWKKVTTAGVYNRRCCWIPTQQSFFFRESHQNPSII